METRYKVSAIYKFVVLDRIEELRGLLLHAMQDNGIRGTLLLAGEGINGTIAGDCEHIDRFMTFLRSDPRFKDIQSKDSYCDSMPFHRTKVKIKKEIVTMGVEDIDPNSLVGTYVEPEQWNDLLRDPGVTVIDTRNKYEVGIGTFQNAINPETDCFQEFPEYVDSHLDPKRHQKVAMYCTGGIRCEKATAYLKQKGYENVYHLKGGILKYLEQVPPDESMWEGECFVFDRRVAVGQGLVQGIHDLCYACRYPVSEEEKRQDTYVKGVSCPHCYHKITDEQRKRFQERQKQVELAVDRGDIHIGQRSADS